LHRVDKIRCVDKLAKGKAMHEILRGEPGTATTGT
jgi:hypothetical protein